MKRIQMLALLLAIGLVLSACGQSPVPAKTTTAAPPQTTADTKQTAESAPSTAPETAAATTEPMTTEAPTEIPTAPADADGIAWQAAEAPRPAKDTAEVLAALRADVFSRLSEFRSSAGQDGNASIGDGSIEAPTPADLPAGIRCGSSVQTDGDDLYLIDGFGLRIQSAAGTKSRLLSYTPVRTGADTGEAWLQTLYVSGNRAAVLYTRTGTEDGIYDTTETHAAIFDISDREAPALIADVGADGGIQTSFLLADGKLLVVTNRYYWDPAELTQDHLPRLRTAGEAQPLPPEQLLLLDSPAAAAFTLLITLSLEDGSVLDAIACDDAGMAVCPGEDALILARQVWSVGSAPAGTDGVYTVTDWTDRTQTELIRLALSPEGKLTPDGSARVDGGMLSPDAVSLVDGRIALITADARYGFRRYADEEKGFTNDTPTEPTLVNRLYMLDSELQEVGRLEHLGKDSVLCSCHLARDVGWFSTMADQETVQLLDLREPKAPALGTALECEGDSRVMRILDDGRLLCLTAGEPGAGVRLARYDVSEPQDVRTEAQLPAEGFETTPAVWFPAALYVSADGSQAGFPIRGEKETAFRLYRWSEKRSAYREIGTTTLEYLPDESQTIRLDNVLYVCSAGVTYALDAKTAELLTTVTDAVG